MYFGYYLVEKNAITKEQLVEGLIFQLDNTPSLLQLIYEERLFNPETILKILKTQLEEFLDIYSVLKRHAFLESKELTELLEKQARKRVPLGNILVKKGYLKIQTAQKLLTDFLATNPITPDAKGTVEAVAPLTVCDPQDAQQMPDFDHCFSQCPMEEALIKDYTDLFDEPKKDDLELAVLSWSKIHAKGDIVVLKESFRDFYRELHTIKGTVRFLKGHLSEHIVHEIEDLFSAIQHVASELTTADCENVESHYLTGIDLLWDLRNQMQSALSEKGLWEKNAWKKRCISYLDHTFELRGGFEGVDSNVSEKEFSAQF